MLAGELMRSSSSPWIRVDLYSPLCTDTYRCGETQHIDDHRRLRRNSLCASKSPFEADGVLALAEHLCPTTHDS